MSKYKSLIIKYAVSLCLGALAVWVTLGLRDFASIADEALRMKALADSFTIPGVIFLMVGVLVWVSTTGFFDFIGYALGSFGRALIPMSKKPHQSFYDYKVSRMEKRASGYSCIFVTGALLVAMAAIFTILFYRV